MLEPYGELLTPKDVSKFLNICENCVYKKIRTGNLKCLKFGRTIRIPKEYFSEYLIAHLKQEAK